VRASGGGFSGQTAHASLLLARRRPGGLQVPSIQTFPVTFQGRREIQYSTRLFLFFLWLASSTLT
jgi:hypothetical protein